MTSRENKIKYGITIFSIIMFIVSYIAHKWNQEIISDVLLLVCLIGYVGLNCFVLFKRKSDKKVELQLLVINFVISLFLWLAFAYGKTTKNFISYFSVLIFSFVFFICIIMIFIQKYEWNMKLKKRNILVSAIFIMFIVFSIDMLNVSPKWDALVYYDATWERVITGIADNFDFTLKSIDAFQLQSHYSYGYAFLAAIGEFFAPKKAYGVVLVQLIMTLIAGGCFYGILNCVFKKYRNNLNIIGMVLFLCTPLIFGTCGHISMDYPMMCLFIIMMYLDIRKYNYLLLFVSILFVFSKEPAIIIFFIYFVLKWFIYFRAKYSISIRNLWRFIKKNYMQIIVFMFPGVLWAVALYVKDGSYFGNWDTSADTGLIITASDATEHYFGFTIHNFIVKLKQIFLMNFTWIFTLVLTICVLIKKSRMKLIRLFKENNMLIVVASAVAGNMLFQFFYITNLNTRYNYVCVVGVLLFGILATYCLIGRVLYRKIFLLLVGVLFIIQSYTSVDVITNLLFTTKNVGGTRVVSAAKDEFSLSDSIVNNRSYIYLEKALTDAYSEIAADNPVIFLEDYKQKKSMELWGDYSERTVHWNSEKKKFTFDEADDNIEFHFIQNDEISTVAERKIYYMEFAWDDSKALEQLSEYYYIGKSKYIRNHGWKIKIYELITK